MDAIQRNPDVASRYQGAPGPGAVQDVNVAAYRRNATLEADTPEPANSQTTVTLSRQAQELAARAETENTRRTGSDAQTAPKAEQASAEQMSLLNAQLRRTYMGAEG